MEVKKLESIPCDQMSGDAFVKKEHYKESNLVDTTSDILCKVLRLQSAPDMDIETFDGNIIILWHCLGKLLKVRLLTLEESLKG